MNDFSIESSIGSLNRKTINTISKFSKLTKTAHKIQQPENSFRAKKDRVFKILGSICLSIGTIYTVFPVFNTLMEIKSCNDEFYACNTEVVTIDYFEQNIEYVETGIRTAYRVLFNAIFSLIIISLIFVMPYKLMKWCENTNQQLVELMREASTVLETLDNTPLHELEKSELEPLLSIVQSIEIDKSSNDSIELSLLKLYIEHTLARKIST
jgi:hypothetical protein